MSEYLQLYRWVLYAKNPLGSSEATTRLMNIFEFIGNEWYVFSLQDISRLYFQKFPFTIDLSFVIFVLLSPFRVPKRVFAFNELTARSVAMDEPCAHLN